MKNLLFPAIIIMLLFNHCSTGNAENSAAQRSTSSTEFVKQLNNDNFKKLIFNYENGKQWKYEGKLPAIIDFYADWCGPCRMLSPRIEEIARQFNGKIVVYKVDTDAETALAQNLGISSLPTLLFIPMKGQPRATMGAVPKETLLKAVKEVLLVE